MLALKAYGAWMRASTASPRARAFGLLDFSLYCNKFAMEQRSTPDADAGLRLVRVRDYFQLVLDAFEDTYQVRVPLFTAADEAGYTETLAVTMPIKAVPDGLLIALQVTLHNWACLEANSESEGVKRAERLFDASRQVEEHMENFSHLGWSWEAVRCITSAVQALMRCDFAAAETASRLAVELVRVNAKGQEKTSTTPLTSTAVSEIDGDTEFLQALAYYTLGIANEASACEESLQNYEEALLHVSEGHNANLYQSVIERAREQLAGYVEEEHHRERMRLAAEEEIAAAHGDRRAQKAIRQRKAQEAARRTARKVSNSRTSFSGQNLSPVGAPPVPEPLQRYLAEHGLSTLVLSVCNFKGVLKALGRCLLEDAPDESLPASLFADTRFEASDGETIFAVLLCTNTPLQWTFRLREAANQPRSTLHRSVWSPRPTLAPLLTELAAQRPPGPKSVAAAQTRKEIVEGNTKLRQQVLQLFAPPSAAPKVKQNAHESVNTVVQLLGQRLGVLLKTERAFEDHWSATGRILSALQSYAVSQDLVCVKRTLMSQQRLRQMRLERSARTIVHFFRDIVGQRALRAEQAAADRQRLAAREQATIVLQKYVRRWLACQEAGRRANERAEYVNKILIVQSLARGKFARAAFDDFRKAWGRQKELDYDRTKQACAALQIQRAYRGHCARLRCYHLRGLVHEVTLHHFRDSRIYYATLIQKCVRGMLVRLQYGKAVYAKRCYGRNVYRRRLWERSCVVIQRAFRAYRLRRARTLHIVSIGEDLLLSDASSGRPLTYGNATKVSAGRANESAAARCIQGAYRSCVARRRCEALKYARARETQSKEQLDWSGAPPFSLKECVF
ncbi:hypothetical protein ABB37_05692 [Leptomonas pyrrhocoris]|uniref:Uncharacterized protein n=1 Tax=Leptomonas pyrrhocoris TaxID=157538 RepID=A0A0M9FZK0_LEPPY|nr:hypothetical protein ABB37_05692 [Leptomonas pyrrhocoris]KPA79203.1 hypothetical protein ABB37_05692 [Leptomonas pyrrhocoris]|eukprot:XP_015657642.1 hypothetical protein ABB37_05692 [Leptomonas pyrrhocoris]